MAACGPCRDTAPTVHTNTNNGTAIAVCVHSVISQVICLELSVCVHMHMLHYRSLTLTCIRLLWRPPTRCKQRLPISKTPCARSQLIPNVRALDIGPLLYWHRSQDMWLSRAHARQSWHSDCTPRPGSSSSNGIIVLAAAAATRPTPPPTNLSAHHDHTHACLRLRNANCTHAARGCRVPRRQRVDKKRCWERACASTPWRAHECAHSWRPTWRTDWTGLTAGGLTYSMDNLWFLRG